MIHVCYGTSELYAKFAATSMVSIFENVTLPPPSVTIHVIHDNSFSVKSRDNFIYLAGRYNQLVEFHNVDELCAPQIQFLREKLFNQINKRFGIYSFFRLLIKSIAFKNVSKLIYLDSDTIVNLDIRELWNYSLENYALASVPEFEATRTYMITDKYVLHTDKVKLEDYFCAGVIMVNLDKLSDNLFEEGAQWLVDNPQCESVEQDVFNYFFSTNYLKLPEKFDAFVGVCRYMDNNALLPKIYHYAGNCLGLNFDDAYDRLFYTHFTKTPWFGLETLQHAYETMSTIYVERQTFAIQVANLLADRKRAFLVGERNVEALKEIFAVRDDEEFLSTADADAFYKLLDSLNADRGKKVFFILVDNFAEVKVALTQLGFVAGEDFLDVTAFLHDGHGVPLQAFTLVKLL